MKKIRFIMFVDQHSRARHYSLPYWLLRILILSCLSSAGLCGFLAVDYYHLKKLQRQHQHLLAENQHLKGEARILLSSLATVKKSLRQIQDYGQKVGDLINLKVANVSTRTGIGPLSEKEYSLTGGGDSLALAETPLGIDLEQLVFRPVLEELDSIESYAQEQSLSLQRLLSTLSRKQSLLSAIPSISPVRGWITSDFGYRISPFTGQRSFHRAIDIAAPVGTPIIAPADGVVIFAGRKAGFGNFIMLAHQGHGIVTRYGHNAQNLVEAGKRVKRGDQIATVGMTGRTTGPHLHYEVEVNGQTVSPRKFILR